MLLSWADMRVVELSEATATAASTAPRSPPPPAKPDKPTVWMVLAVMATRAALMVALATSTLWEAVSLKMVTPAPTPRRPTLTAPAFALWVTRSRPFTLMAPPAVTAPEMVAVVPGLMRGVGLAFTLTAPILVFAVRPTDSASPLLVVLEIRAPKASPCETVWPAEPTRLPPSLVVNSLSALLPPAIPSPME